MKKLNLSSQNPAPSPLLSMAGFRWWRRERRWRTSRWSFHGESCLSLPLNHSALGGVSPALLGLLGMFDSSHREEHCEKRSEESATAWPLHQASVRKHTDAVAWSTNSKTEQLGKDAPRTKTVAFAWAILPQQLSQSQEKQQLCWNSDPCTWPQSAGISQLVHRDCPRPIEQPSLDPLVFIPPHRRPGGSGQA